MGLFRRGKKEKIEPISRTTVCPCCGANTFPTTSKIDEYNHKLNYVEVINKTDNLHSLVRICTECGYCELFDKDISGRVIEELESDAYIDLLHANVDKDLKKWLLAARLSEVDGNYSEAAIEYLKGYDLQEKICVNPDTELLWRAAHFYNLSTKRYMNFKDAIMTVDCWRRLEDFVSAEIMLQHIEYFFENSLTSKEMKLIDMEHIWLDLQVTEKKELEF